MNNSKNRITIPNAIMLAEVDFLLKEGHPVVIMTKGSSMLPFIRGDRDSVQMKRLEEYRIGQAVLAQIAPGHYVLHRIVNISGEDVTLQGDGNLKGQEHCRLDDICGAVVQILRPSGKITGPMDEQAARWRTWPYMIRRICLAIKRRII